MVLARFAVVPTHNRPAELAKCLQAIGPQVERVFVIDNASFPPVEVKGHVVIRDLQQPPNLSRLWNLGLAAVERYAAACELDEWDVAILNDDAIPYADWMDRVCAGIRSTSAIAGCTIPTVPKQLLLGPEAKFGIGTRVTGWAFVIRGEACYRFDEQFVWWCGDDDLSAYARNNGGLVMVPGSEVPNTLANTSTVGANLTQSAIDMQTFVDKYGRRPW